MSWSACSGSGAKGETNCSKLHHVTAGMLVALAILSFGVLLLAMRRDLDMFDEGIILSNVMRVLDGEMIHRDFFTVYGPAQFYIIAGAFKVFGENFLVTRIYDLLIRTA